MKIDKLRIFNDSSQQSDTGVFSYRTDVTSNIDIPTPTHVLTGLGMSSDLPILDESIDGNITFSGGISYEDFEFVELFMGVADDTVTVEDSTEATVRVIHGGGGGDTLRVTSQQNLAPVVLFGDTSQAGAEYRPATGLATGFAHAFNVSETVFPSNDVIDARGAAQQIIAFGGPGNDSIYGSNSDDQLSGGSGSDLISGQAGNDHLYGDGGFNINTTCLLYTSPSPRDLSTSRMPSSA